MKYALVTVMILTAAVGCREQQLRPGQEQQPSRTTTTKPEERSLSSLATQPTAPQPIEPKPDKPARVPTAGRAYTVVKGDTFWSIARRVYGDGKLWTRIQEANPDVDPNNLKPGQVIAIPPK